MYPNVQFWDLLLLAYISDLPDAVKSSNVRLFADDSLLYMQICNQHDQEHLQQDLQRLEDWENTWQMSFNPSKCNTFRISPSKRKNLLPTAYYLHGQQLVVASSSKYLRVTTTVPLGFGWRILVQRLSVYVSG